MKFRFVMLGPDDKDGNAALAAARVPHSSCRVLRYEQGEPTSSAWNSGRMAAQNPTPVANFTIRIARDRILDDGEEERREFGLEAELGGRRVAFAVSAAEFRPDGLGTE
jgi:hypothetical protein